MRYVCRCRRKACQARRTLRKHPDEYSRPPRCSCGSRGWRIDWYRMRREYPLTCGCGGYHFPHRPGGGDCWHNPMAEYRWLREHGGTAAEIEDAKVRGVNTKLQMMRGRP